MKRTLTDTEKRTVDKYQEEKDGSLRCFISGEIISPSDETEYDHIQAYAKEGETDVSNMRVVLKKYNRRKKDQSLYQVRDNLKLERLFEQRRNKIKLQDLLELKSIEHRNFHPVISTDTISIDDGKEIKNFALLSDAILEVKYFYGRIPISWLENDDQEGLQPRVIDYKRLIVIRDHLKSHPQLAPSIGRLVDNRLKLFDGQHKLAGQIMNDQNELDVKIYISPSDSEGAKKLFDALMITNLDAHSKLKQVPFYTSTLLDRISVIYKEFLEEFISTKDVEQHTEENFINFLVVEKQFPRAKGKEMLRGAIKTNVLENSPLKQYVAEASKDASYPMTIDLLSKTIFPVTLYLEPSSGRFNTNKDHRDAEVENFNRLASIIVTESCLSHWISNPKSKGLTNLQLKARRIWHKGSVLTWAPYLESIIIFSFQITTTEGRERMLYRHVITDEQEKVLSSLINRLFSHPMWDEPEGELDSLLVSAQKQDLYFNKKGLTEDFVLHGRSK